MMEDVRKKKYRGAKKLLICADSSGSNAYQISLWKYEIQKFFKEEKIDITIFYFSPKISK